ncbi:hypothetical protein GWI33_007788 [Rhynchophorus ferrugineus]|uniref:Uncharacterized protein n=1 Tax=Rhynchophorus ferrugineus TaxID=354439 RepID=A0A834MCS7_RHYFE|nr:hypothetical protein GWI33_007788 [Rhynchophorus ferrugineus]
MNQEKTNAKPTPFRYFISLRETDRATVIVVVPTSSGNSANYKRDQNLARSSRIVATQKSIRVKHVRDRSLSLSAEFGHKVGPWFLPAFNVNCFLLNYRYSATVTRYDFVSPNYGGSIET